MITLEPKTYDHFIFDCDGVVLDSNEIKKCNIREAVKEHIDAERLEEFLQFFTQGNGRPREVKIRRYFDDESIINTILKRYNDLNLGALRRAPVIAGIVEVLKVLKQAGAHSIVLSGAEEDELRDILGSKGLLEYFSSIYGGPKDKKSHLNELKLAGRCLYFGDSKVDFETAQHFGYEFIFVSGVTQFFNWKEFFTDKTDVKIISDFNGVKIER